MVFHPPMSKIMVRTSEFLFYLLLTRQLAKNSSCSNQVTTLQLLNGCTQPPCSGTKSLDVVKKTAVQAKMRNQQLSLCPWPKCFQGKHFFCSDYSSTTYRPIAILFITNNCHNSVKFIPDLIYDLIRPQCRHAQCSYLENS